MEILAHAHARLSFPLPQESLGTRLVRTLIYLVSTVQPNSRVCRPCMTILREPTTFDSVIHGDVALVTEESKFMRMRYIP